MKILRLLLPLTLATALLPATAGAATLVATYQFNNSLAADQGGVPALTAVDPTAQSGFVVDTVFGNSEYVYRFAGTPSQNGGLSLNTTGLLTPNSYSAELLFNFDNVGGWRRVLDVQDRQSDNGFYVDPGSHLNVFPASGSGPTTFSAGYHHVVLTVAADGTVKGYIDGQTDFITNTAVMNLSNSINNTLNLFLDNIAGGGQQEYSSGRISKLLLYNGPLTAAEALARSQVLPEPGSVALIGLPLLMLLGAWRGRSVR